MRILLADDEALARARLRALLAELGPDHEVVAEAANGREALQRCSKGDIDLVLLDIQMPGQSGIEVARQLNALPQPPAVIFTTAHAEHALAAFDVRGIDYLLKPVRPERLREALTRLPSAVADSSQPGLMLRASYRGGVELIPIADILYLKAEDKYVRARHAGGEALLDDSLKSLEEQVPEHWLRVHRNALVARTQIRGVERDHEGRIWLTLRGVDERIEVSRRHVAGVRALLGASRL